MKYIKYVFLIIVSVFSFYISDKVVLIVENHSPIMKKIKKESDKYATSSVNAIIEGNTIIPGISGVKINERESYLSMNDFGDFNETFFVYDKVKPDISLYDNLDKTIIKGRKEGISILSSNEIIVSFLKNNNVNVTKVITDNQNIDESIENINGKSDLEEFKKLNIHLSRKHINKKICLKDYSNIDECLNNKYFLVSPSKFIKKSNLIEMKMNIENGDIIYLSDFLTKEEVKIILSEIKYRDLKVIKLSELIEE